eukprot:jgi/Ulvmu1/5706/UM024_0055.1
MRELPEQYIRHSSSIQADLRIRSVAAEKTKKSNMDPELLKMSCLCMCGLAMAAGVAAQRLPTECVPVVRPEFEFSLERAWTDIANAVCGSQPANIDAQARSLGDMAGFEAAVAISGCDDEDFGENFRMETLFRVLDTVVLESSVRDIVAQAPSCLQSRCPAASALLSLSETMYPTAVTGAWTEIYLLSDARESGVAEILDLSSAAIASTISTALPRIVDAIQQAECSNAALDEISLDELLASCSRPTGMVIDTIPRDTMFEAGEALATFLCSRNSSEAELDVIVSATTTALAEALEMADAICSILDPDDLNPMPCELLPVDIDDVVSGQVEEFVSGATILECDCDQLITGDGLVEIWNAAALNAYAETCTGATSRHAAY